MYSKNIRNLFALLILTLSFNTHAIIIDFEGASGTATGTGDFLDVGDYRFTLSNDISSGFGTISGQNNLIESNTTKLFVANHAEMTMSRIDGAAFNLNSLDISGSWINSPGRWADHVDLIAGGNTSTANLAGMPSSYLNISPNFFNITSVLFRPFGNTNGGGNNYEFIIDNISVTTASVPEPSIIWLLGSGLVLVGFLRRKV